MNESSVNNAVITDATITKGDRALLTSFVMFDFGGFCQGFGDYALYLPHQFRHTGGPNFAGHWIFRVMEIAGVDEWHRLVGKCVRVETRGGFIVGIGHIVKDDWFRPESDFTAMRNHFEEVTHAQAH